MKILNHQGWHAVLLFGLLFFIFESVQHLPSLLEGDLWGMSTTFWLVLAIASPIAHQIYVLFFWRWELHYHGMSHWLGKKAFSRFKSGFSVLIASRLVTIIFLGISNTHTLECGGGWTWGLALVLSLPVVFLFYSVAKYFGMDRAFGLDHFDPEKVRKMPFVKKGIFKYTSNGMYLYGFFLLWIPGLLFQSEAALLAALFNHLYIWVHYFFTELPDIRVIYREN